MAIISVNHLHKAYPVSLKEPGLWGTLHHFWHRRYRQVLAVQDISFTVEPGEIVGFLGANGAGKTTTLKMLTGLIHPTAGSVEVAGYCPQKRNRSFLQKITLVMGQKQQLIWDLPVLDSLKINAAVYDIPEAVAQYRIAELAEMLSIQDKLKQPLRKLSLGERMKAELLAALLHQPKVLFLDEPTLGLDVNAQVSVRNFLREFNRNFQATILLTSHYMADISALCDRVMLIHQGGLIYDGKLDHLLEQFSPFREVRLELGSPIALADLQEFGESIEMDGLSVRLLLHREVLTDRVAQLLARFNIADLTITDPPLEEVIGKVFREGSVSE